MIRPATLSALLVFSASAACNHTGPIDPTAGALHLNTLGQSDAYGRNPDATPLSASAKTPVRRDRYGGFEQAVRDRWVHRDLHEAEGIDVDAVFDLLRSEGAAARTKVEQRATVRRATCRLGDGNLRLVEPTAGLHSTSGVQLRALRRGFLVVGTDGRYGASIEAGDRVMEVDGRPTPAWVDTTCAAPGSTAGQRFARLAVSLERTPAGRDQGRARTLTVRKAKSGRTKEVSLQWKPEDETLCALGRAFTEDVGLIEVRRLDCDPATFDQQLTDASTAAGNGHVLLDLRRTVGNDPTNAQVVARRFSPAATVWASKRPGSHGGFTHEPLPESGPPIQMQTPWLLIGPRCAGSCELAAAVLAADARVTTVGKATAGSVAETTTVSVGEGISIEVPTVQYALPGTATALEGRGVTPDIEVTPTVDILARSQDPELIAVARRIRDGE